jgi:hypothetical protein
MNETHTTTTTHTLLIDGLDARGRKTVAAAAAEYGATARTQTHGRYRSTTHVDSKDFGYACDIADVALNASEGVTVTFRTIEATESETQPGAFRYHEVRNSRYLGGGNIEGE